MSLGGQRPAGCPGGTPGAHHCAGPQCEACRHCQGSLALCCIRSQGRTPWSQLAPTQGTLFITGGLLRPIRSPPLRLCRQLAQRCRVLPLQVLSAGAHSQAHLGEVQCTAPGRQCTLCMRILHHRETRLVSRALETASVPGPASVVGRSGDLALHLSCTCPFIDKRHSRDR